jgi:hypothetical protein
MGFLQGADGHDLAIPADDQSIWGPEEAHKVGRPTDPNPLAGQIGGVF